MLARTLLGIGLVMLLTAGAPTAALAADPPPPLPDFEWVPCAVNGHQVTVFSEGTAWNRGMKAAWLTVFNPTGASQNVWVRVYVDGQLEPVKRHVLLNPHTRFAWHMNDELLGLESPAHRKDFNFATEVFFETVGVANIAVWELGSVGFPAYLRAAYLKGTDLCVTW